MARIGFYGGTFNPIHLGHVGVCRQAVKQLRLDCLHVIPAFIPPHKASPDLAAGEDRLAMCRLALQGLPNIPSRPCGICGNATPRTIFTSSWVQITT